MVDWAAWEQVGLAIDTAGGVLFVILGILVSTMKLQTREQKWFIAFAVSFGLFYTLNNLRVIVWDWNAILRWPDLAARFTTMVCSIGLGLSLVGARAARKAWPAALLALAVIALHITAPVLANMESTRAFDLDSEIGYAVSYGGLTWLVLVQAWLQPDRRVGIVSFAMIPFIATNAGLRATLFTVYGRETFIQQVGGNETVGLWVAWLLGLAFLVMAGSILVVWSVQMIKHPEDVWSRRIVLATASFTLIGTLWTVFTIEGAPNNLGILGVTRVVGVVLLAYGIVRTNVLGLDLKMKTGLKQSTVAAIFIASFFVVSEMVSGLLSEQVGVIAGVLTTGLLVFAIAPLQQFGERIASKAFPDAKPLDERSLKERMDMYEAMLRSAWQDGVITRTESEMLSIARAKLELTNEQVLKIEKRL